MPIIFFKCYLHKNTLNLRLTEIAAELRFPEDFSAVEMYLLYGIVSVVVKSAYNKKGK